MTLHLRSDAKAEARAKPLGSNYDWEAVYRRARRLEVFLQKVEGAKDDKEQARAARKYARLSLKSLPYPKPGLKVQ